MSSVLLLEAIGYLDEDLLERSEEWTAPKRKVWVKWAALAACMCFVCLGAWGVFSDNAKSADDCAPEAMNPAEGSEEHVAKPTDTKPAMEYWDSLTGDLVTECEILKVQIIQTNPVTERDGKQALIFSSRKELDAYIAANDMVFANTNFASVCQQYDNEFFDQKQLIVVALEGNSSSVSHEVADSLQWEGNGWNICVRRFYPKTMMMNLVYCHAFVEIEAGTLNTNDSLAIQYVDFYAEE